VTGVFFDYSTEQQDFRAALRALVADRAPLAAARARLGDAHDPDLWRVLCADLTVPGLAVPEQFGGAGFTLEETAVAVAELSRTLAAVPALFATLAMLVRPTLWRWFASGSVAGYALTPSGWDKLLSTPGT